METMTFPELARQLREDRLKARIAAYNQGKVDGRSGMGNNNPWSKGERFYRQYEQGYEDGRLEWYGMQSAGDGGE